MTHNKKGKSAGSHLVVITGPTGIGKTSICADIAAAFNSPVISADSRQMYKEMKTGTSVPSNNELAKAQHFFVGNLSVGDYYNASMFETECLQLLKNLFKKNKIVFMTGGSGLYIDAVCGGIDELPSVDPELRNELAKQYKERGIAWLRSKLRKLDPEHYDIVDLRNPNRILKAVEISLMTGKPYSAYLTGTKKERPFKIVKIGLVIQRSHLYEIINARVDKMVRDGLVEEARKLYVYKHLNALNTVGYKEFFEYFEGKITYDKAIELIKRNSRRYAKRQLTWLARDNNIQWFNPTDREGITSYIVKSAGHEPDYPFE